MNPHHHRPALALLALAPAVLFPGCSKPEPSYTEQAAQAVESARASTAQAWEDTKSLTFERREELAAQLKAMEAKFQADVSHFRAGYAEAEASAARRNAMAELQSAEADFRDKFQALGTATADTWNEVREKTVAAWDRLQAAYAKAQAEK